MHGARHQEILQAGEEGILRATGSRSPSAVPSLASINASTRSVLARWPSASAKRRAGLIESFWTPRAERIALHKVSSLPPRACVADFRQRGGMCPSVSSLIRLYEAAGRHWEEIADDALARIRAAEAIPDEASCITVQIDGVMVPVGPDNRRKDERLGGIVWREAACATISLDDASGTLLRTIRHCRIRIA